MVRDEKWHLKPLTWIKKEDIEKTKKRRMNTLLFPITMRLTQIFCVTSPLKKPHKGILLIPNCQILRVSGPQPPKEELFSGARKT
jgi:hypothetical protein